MININNLSKLINVSEVNLYSYNFDFGLFDEVLSIDQLSENWFNDISKLYNIEIDYFTFIEKVTELTIKDQKRRKLKVKKDTVLESKSKEISDLIKDSFFDVRCDKYIIHVGPTSSGKTYNAIQSLNKSNGNCAYLSPLRLLAWEVYEKLKDTNNGCNLLTGEDSIYNYSNITSSTIEMVDPNVNYDIVVVDESFMISDPFRGKAWSNIIFNIKAKEIHLICNKECLELITNILTYTNRNFIINEYDRKVPIEFGEKEISIDNIPNKTLIVVFSRKSVVVTKSILESKGYNVSILYGNLPPEIKKAQIEKFINGSNNICVTTDVIGMGLNVPCDYVCFYEIEKFDGDKMRLLTPIEIRQIGGRAGRYLLSDKGIITSNSINNLLYVKNAYNIDMVVDIAYYGLEEWMIDYLVGDNIKEKLEFFSKLDIIPYKLRKYINKQSVSNLIDIIDINKNIYKLSYSIIWKLINLPICKNNSDYFSHIVDSIIANIKIDPPLEIIESINNEEDLVSAEILCKKYDIYLYSTRGHLKEYFNLYRKDIEKRREELIKIMDDYLSIKKVEA